jgi:transposase InsO family protein
MKDKCAAEHRDDTISPGYELMDGLLYFKHRLMVPSALRETVLKAEHDSKVAGHWGTGKTVEIVGRNFHWPNMDDQIRQYVHQCDSCQRNKPSRHRRNGLLHPLELPNSLWSSISMDFITDLPESENCTTIWVVVDRFTKMAHFIPLKEKTATYVARQFVTHIWKAHGLPDNILSDRDTAFTSKFWKEVTAFLGIQQRMSTAFHSQTDGQTERINQVLEAYLREYCNYEQNDWGELLPLAEYAYNNSFASVTGLSPFYANYGFHPRTNWPTAEQPRNPGSEHYAHWLQAVHDQAKAWLEATRDRMAKYWVRDHLRRIARYCRDKYRCFRTTVDDNENGIVTSAGGQVHDQVHIDRFKRGRLDGGRWVDGHEIALLLRSRRLVLQTLRAELDVLLDQRAQSRPVICGCHSVVRLLKTKVAQRVVRNVERVFDRTGRQTNAVAHGSAKAHRTVCVQVEVRVRSVRGVLLVVIRVRGGHGVLGIVWFQGVQTLL